MSRTIATAHRSSGLGMRAQTSLEANRFARCLINAVIGLVDFTCPVPDFPGVNRYPSDIIVYLDMAG